MANDTFDSMIDQLSRCRRVLITTHVRPDGDALGTCAAMSLGLAHKKIDSEVLLLSHLPKKYAFVFEESRIQYRDVEAGWPEDFSLDSYDAFLALDTGTWSQLPGMEAKLANFKKPKLVLDHHLTQQNWADVLLVDTTAAAAGEIAAELLERWKVPMDSTIASALYLAIVTDTGWFQFSNTSPRTLRLAAKLMEAGVNTDLIYKRLYQNERPQRLALQTRAQGTMELFAGDRLAVMRVRKEDFEQTHSSMNDTENLINIPLQIRTVEVSILITEPKDYADIRISLRSKGSVDVAKFAEQFGGGGHARASGLRIPGKFEDARDRVVNAMIRQLEK